MRVHLCGVRGSTPAPGSEFVRYGGNTSCVAVTADGDDRPTLVLDAGTGIRRVSPLLGGVPFVGTVLLSHLHWDHTQGLPFFQLGDHPDAEVRLLVPEQTDGVGAEATLARCMTPPFFPIDPGQLRGSWLFDSVPRESFDAGTFTVTARTVPHKGGETVGYRVSDGRATVAYLPDHCPTALGPGEDGLGAYHHEALALCENADVLIHDAQLVTEELEAEASWGHAAAEYAVALGRRCGVGTVVLFHHKPSRTDDELDILGARLSEGSVPVVVGAESSVFDLPGRL